MEVSKNFILQEFIPKEIWYKPGIDPRWFIDPRVIKIAQFLRDRYGLPATINNWYRGGEYNESGYRLPTTETGAKFSQHKFGRAIDVKWLSKTIDFYDVVREDILKHESEFLDAGITTVENGTPTWLHVDCRYTGMGSILFV